VPLDLPFALYFRLGIDGCGDLREYNPPELRYRYQIQIDIRTKFAVGEAIPTPPFYAGRGDRTIARRAAGGCGAGWVRGAGAKFVRIGRAPPGQAGAQPCPVDAPLEKTGQSGWPAGGLWGYQGRQMGQNLPLCGQLGPTRSRQDESNEVREIGSKRTSSGGNGGHAVSFRCTP
jgi:hypothetical protein